MQYIICFSFNGISYIHSFIQYGGHFCTNIMYLLRRKRNYACNVSKFPLKGWYIRIHRHFFLRRKENIDYNDERLSTSEIWNNYAYNNIRRDWYYSSLKKKLLFLTINIVRLSPLPFYNWNCVKIKFFVKK